MKEKILAKINSAKGRIAVVGAGVGTALATTCTNAFAMDESMTTSMTTALTSVKTDALSAISLIAPIALAIFAAIFVWNIGKAVFKMLAKG